MRSVIFLLSLFYFLSCTGVLHGQSYYSKVYDFDNGDFDLVSNTLMHQDTLYFRVTEDCGTNFCSRFVIMDSLGNVIKERHYSDIRMNNRNSMIVDDDELIVLATTVKDSAYYRLIFMDRFSLDTLRSFRYYPERKMIFMADAALESFGDYYILMGWSKEDENNWPERMLWVNKQTMEVDTTVAFTNPDAMGIWNNGHVHEDRFYGVYDLKDPVLYDLRGIVGWDLNMNQVFDYQVSTLNQSNLFQNTTMVLNNGNIVYETAKTDDIEYLNLSCIDISGAILWSNTELRSEDPSFGNKIWHFSETSDGDILACGISTWFLGYEGDDPYPLTLEMAEREYDAAYILKLDGDTGDIIWEYRLVEIETDGKVRKTNLLGIYELSDGSLMGIGYIRHKDAGGFYTVYDTWVVRLPADGCRPEYDCVKESYTSATKEINVTQIENKNYRIYPNPSFDGSFIVQTIDQFFKTEKIIVYDVHGRQILIETISDRHHDLELNDISGIYYYHIMSHEGKIVQQGKLVKI